MCPKPLLLNSVLALKPDLVTSNASQFKRLRVGRQGWSGVALCGVGGSYWEGGLPWDGPHVPCVSSNMADGASCAGRLCGDLRATLPPPLSSPFWQTPPSRCGCWGPERHRNAPHGPFRPKVLSGVVGSVGDVLEALSHTRSTMEVLCTCFGPRFAFCRNSALSTFLVEIRANYPAPTRRWSETIPPPGRSRLMLVAGEGVMRARMLRGVGREEA